MKIDLKCCCGAEFHMDDTGNFINSGGKPDDVGRIYIAQVESDKWQSLHHGHAVMRGSKQ